MMFLLVSSLLIIYLLSFPGLKSTEGLERAEISLIPIQIDSIRKGNNSAMACHRAKIK